METALTRLLDLEVPVVQAPMAGVSTPALAIAAAGAGALGSVAVGALDVPSARAAIAETRHGTKRPFAVNVFVHDPPTRDPELERQWIRALETAFREFGVTLSETLPEGYRSFNADDEMLALLVAMRPAVVSCHFGVPAPDRVAGLKAAGVTLMATATTVDEALTLQAAGVDVVVAQGLEAGGHYGAFAGTDPGAALSTMALVPRIVDAVRVPVVAAGGIADGRGIAAALALGAAGAQLGTAFVSCPESRAAHGYRARLAAAGARTRMTDRISGRPARGLMNRLMLLTDTVAAQPPPYPIAYQAIKAAIASAGCPDLAVEWAGLGAGGCRPMPAAGLVAVLAAELEHTLAVLGAVVPAGGQ